MHLYSLDNGMVTVRIESGAMQPGLKNLLSGNPVPNAPLLIHTCSSHSMAERVLPLIGKMSRSVVLTHQAFASLDDPNAFLYRFLGSVGDGISLFEFFRWELGRCGPLMAETVSAFEDSLFSFYFDRTEQAYSGFMNVLKMNPHDMASLCFADKCRKLLENKKEKGV